MLHAMSLVYVSDPSRAPKGAALVRGPRGGLYYEAGKFEKYKPAPKPKAPPKGKAAPKGKGGGKGAAEKPEKHVIGQPFKGGDDLNLPANVKLESAEVKDAWVQAFNDTLAAGGSEADAKAAANKVLPKRGPIKPPKKPVPVKIPKRNPGDSFAGPNDPHLPVSVRNESEDVRKTWTDTFNKTLANGGSEADATAAARKTLPDRSGKAPAPEKRKIGQPFGSVNDPNLPKNVQTQTQQVRATWTQTFNSVLMRGGSEAEAMALANQALPNFKPIKPPKPKVPPKAKTPPKPQKVAIKMQTTIPFDDETWAPVELASREKADGSPLKAMAAFFPDESVASQLAILNSQDISSSLTKVLPQEELHITVAYYPEVDPDDVGRLIQQVALAASQIWNGTITTEVEGVGEFAAVDLTPFVLLMDPTQLARVHDTLCTASSLASSEHGYIPHMTLAYLPAGVKLDLEVPEVEMTFKRLSLVIGDQRYDFPLGADLYGDATALAPAYRSIRAENIDSVGESADAMEQPHVVVSRTTSDGMTDTETISEKAGRRVAGGWRSKIANAMDTLKGVLSWADYEDEENLEEMAEKAFSVAEENGSSIFAFKDTEGQDRWLSVSSNAFRDRQREIVSTEALTRTVEKADMTGDRGPLRIYHIPGTDIGDCDFQAVHGRFLMESGTFRDSELALKAKEFIRNADSPLAISVGFRYPASAFDGTVHKQIEIFERSILPVERAANPWTTFLSLKGDYMDANKEAFLGKIAGTPLANAIKASLDVASKELEASVAFKELAETDPGAAAFLKMKSLVAASSDPTLQAAFKDFESSVAPAETPAKTEEPKTETPVVVTPAATVAEPEAQKSESSNAELLAALKSLIDPLSQELSTLKATVTTMQTAIAEKSADAGDSATPRAAHMFQATKAASNVETEASAIVAEALKSQNEANDSNPAAPYVADLMGSAFGRTQ